MTDPLRGRAAATVGLFEAVSRMRVVPVSHGSIVPIALAAAVPLVPVFATQLPVKEAVLKVLAPLMGL